MINWPQIDSRSALGKALRLPLRLLPKGMAMPKSGQSRVKLNVGSGLHVVPGYMSLDNSPSLLIQQNPVLRRVVGFIERMFGKQLYTRFDQSVRRWDVKRGLPYDERSVEVIYSSHLLEHLPRRQAEEFLRETHRVLCYGGVLRLALPDLERKARQYLKDVQEARAEGQSLGCSLPADTFLRTTLLGIESRCSLVRPFSVVRAVLMRGTHLWMWDAPSLMALLRMIGFREVCECAFRESTILEAALLDLESRKDESFYVEARK